MNSKESGALQRERKLESELQSGREIEKESALERERTKENMGGDIEYRRE